MFSVTKLNNNNLEGLKEQTGVRIKQSGLHQLSQSYN